MKFLPTSYYIDLGFKDVREGMYDLFTFDSEDIPLYRYPWGLEYNTIFICHYALYNLQVFSFERDQKRLDEFVRISRWLLKKGKNKKNGMIFEFDFPLANLNLKPPWISAMAQGRAASVFTRAYEITDENSFLEAAQKSIRPFFLEVPAGGVRSEFPDGSPALEEYSSKPKSLVLNGMIVALFGLIDLCRFNVDCDFLTLKDDLVSSLEKNIELYDLGFWTYYSLFKYKPLANIDYHKYHVLLSWKLYEITGRKIFLEKSLKWDNYLNSPVKISARHALRLIQKTAVNLKIL
ncbi:hypothetical protein JXL83_01285 [candidate division WOR-3 bacterium]|nr:hypothetical protein [candidate division WOR-3 bacterium]